MKVITFIIFIFSFITLILKLYYKKIEINKFVEFHEKSTKNIISGHNNDYYPFFTDDGLHRMENNIKSIEGYINAERNIIIEDKHKLQAIISDISHQVKTPMANIKMINEILLSRKLDEK